MTTDPTGDVPLDIPFARLERTLIDEYVRAQGYDPQHLSALPQAQRDALLAAASVYASAKLTEVESRSRYVREMHDGAGRKSNRPE